VIVISVYMLLYGERIGTGIRSVVHSADGDDYPQRIQSAVFGYVRGQLLFSLIALFSGEPLDALWLTIAFTALQQIEGHIVAPTVFSQALRINPLLVIFALLLGGQVYGFIGAFVALPAAAIVRESVVYFRRHYKFERWDLPSATDTAPEARSCPECGAPCPEGATECPSCGTELGGPDAEAAAASSAPT
jgi:predicted PurR-regulated permease PerM